MKLWLVEMDYEARDPIDLDMHPGRYYVLAEGNEEAINKVYANRRARVFAHNALGGKDAKAIRTVELKGFIP